MKLNAPLPDPQPQLSALASKGGAVCYAANAASGPGGRDEFLRLMKCTMDQLPRSRVLSRRSTTRRAECLGYPFRRFAPCSAGALGQIPIFRRRRHLLTLLGDIDYDSRLSGHSSGLELSQGLMGMLSVVRCGDWVRECIRRRGESPARRRAGSRNEPDRHRRALRRQRGRIGRRPVGPSRPVRAAHEVRSPYRASTHAGWLPPSIKLREPSPVALSSGGGASVGLRVVATEDSCTNHIEIF